MHTSFNQTVATTGRLSSSEPNLQNIPIRTELGRRIRQAFIPGPACVLISADYSQIELRVLAHLCGDEALTQAFAEEQDIHAVTASADFTTRTTNAEEARQERMIGVRTGIFRHQHDRLRDGIGAAAQQNRNAIGRFGGILTSRARLFQRRGQ